MMRLLKQMSLDGHSPLNSFSTSLVSFRFHHHHNNNSNNHNNQNQIINIHFNNNHHNYNFLNFGFNNKLFNTNNNNNDFGKHLTEILDYTIRLLNSIIHDEKSISDSNNENKISKNKKNNEKKITLLKSLESLNACIVTLIEMCEFLKTLQLSSNNNNNNGNNYNHEKSNNEQNPKYKIRRHHSTFVSGGGDFLSNRNVSNFNNDNHHYDSNKRSTSTQYLYERDINMITSNEQIYYENIIENSIHKLIESNIINLLLDSLLLIGFEEKKMARIILTNSLTIQIKNDNNIIVDYICNSSMMKNFLEKLIKSYEYKKSDVTLNCGCIIRFACQFEQILMKILQSNYFYKFFDYMKQSSSNDYPFDVSMDIFFTFKTIMSKHKKSTCKLLLKNCDTFFNSLIDLLKHAEEIEDYVTKRQTLEVLTEILADNDRYELREKFLQNHSLIKSVIRYLWNRNLQIRLRCLILISQFSINPLLTSLDENVNKNNNHQQNSYDYNEINSDSIMNCLIENIMITFIEIYDNDNNNDDDDDVNLKIIKNFNELKIECQKSNVKNFEKLVHFIDQMIQFIVDH